MIQKVQAFIYRKSNNLPELLLFEHGPTKTHQLIRGTLEKDESLEQAILREIHEESGLEDVELVKKLGEEVIRVPSGPTRSGPLETQIHHAYLIQLKILCPNNWTHFAKGSKEEEGIPFHFYWAPIDVKFQDIPADDFKPFIPALFKEVITL